MVIRATSVNDAQLQFIDSASCKRWIESLPLTNLQAAHSALSEQVALVRHANVAPAELLRLLELLREPVEYVQSGLAQKYTGKALPLDPSEQTLWLRVVSLWHEMTDAYLACRDAHVRGDPALRNQGAEPMNATTAQFGAFVTSEIKKWGEVVRAVDLKAE